MPMKPAYYQNRLDRLNTMAQRKPLNQAQQRTMTNLQSRLGIKPQDTAMPKAKPMVSPQASNTPNPADIGKTWDYGAPAGGNTGSIASGYNTGAPAPAGPGPGLMGGVAAPGTSNTPNAAPPPGFTFKKGGKVKKMASGGMTSKSSTASRRGDGIAQRGKTKGRMV